MGKFACMLCNPIQTPQRDFERFLSQSRESFVSLAPNFIQYRKFSIRNDTTLGHHLRGVLDRNVKCGSIAPPKKTPEHRCLIL